MNSSDLIQRLEELESDVNYLEPPTITEPEFRYLPGTLPVLVSAPHGAAHTREGQPKGEDEFTAGFACLVGELAGAHVLYSRRKSNTDPNYYAAAPYKQALGEIVKKAGIGFVLDIHGAHATRPYGIALGTIGGRSCPPAWESWIIQTLKAHGFRESWGGETPAGWPEVLAHLKVNLNFAGGHRQYTVTRYACEVLGIHAAQFELNAHLRTVRRAGGSKKPLPVDRARIENTLLAFADLAQGIAAFIA